MITKELVRMYISSLVITKDILIHEISEERYEEERIFGLRRNWDES